MAATVSPRVERRRALLVRDWIGESLRYAPSLKRVPHKKKSPCIPFEIEITEVVRFAQHAGYHAEMVLRDNFLTRAFSRRVVLVNGILCAVVVSRSKIYPSRLNLTSYSMAHFLIERLKQHRFVLVLQIVPGFFKKVFVIPTPEILKHCREGQRYKVIYLPLMKRKRVNSSGYWRYENAFHLFGKKPANRHE